MKSIRTRLMLLIAGAFLLSWIALTVLVYSEARHETAELFDAELARFAEIIANIPIDKNIILARGHSDILKASPGHPYGNHISVQHWIDGELAFHSQNIPESRVTFKNGFSDVALEGEKWRMFQIEISDKDYLIVGEQYVVRNELIHNISVNTITPMIWTLPLLLFFLQIAISKGLKPLKNLSNEVKKRGQNALQPIAVKTIPFEVRPLARALNNLMSRLQEAFEKEASFTADASHELRTPLAGVKSQTQLALRYTREPETIAALNKALSGLERCNRTVEQMLTLHRLNPEQADKYFETVELEALTRAVCEDLKPKAEEKDITLSADFGTNNSGLLTAGYPPGLYIMIKNIIENALNYTPREGRVGISIGKEGDQNIRLDVTDNGPGIPKELRQKVFGRFFRQPGNLAPGAGLGLSIVKQLADLHRAEISLENIATSTGLRFSILFKNQANHSI